VTAPRRPFDHVRALLIARARERRNPFDRTDPGTAERILRDMRSTASDEWVAAFGGAARVCRRDIDAYGYWRVARYPAPTSEPKRDAYRRSQEHYLRAMRDADPPLAQVEIPFRRRPGEGTVIVAHLRVPKARVRQPLLVMWGGIDSFKEERRPEPFLAAGLATLGIDMPGVADAPIAGSGDAERMWDAIFDWALARDDVDPDRVAVMGNSTGGYWAAKLARTHRERIRAAVDNGGPVHGAFEEEWIARAQLGEYPFELAETLAAAFGGATYDDWVRIAPSLSLKRLGLLERPSAPLLAVHGEDDTVFPVADARLLIEHGADALIVPGGHMGSGDVTGAIVRWLKERLRA
jgi:pimeloyl-ACP methyl ester carboxylesterase